MENIHLTGLSIAVSTFLAIGLFHPIVIKMEYYFGVRLWWIFFLRASPSSSVQCSLPTS